MSDKLKVGVVGAGLIAQKRHIPIFMKLKEKVEVAAVCDRNESLARQAATEHGIPGIYQDFTEMLCAAVTRHVSRRCGCDSIIGKIPRVRPAAAAPPTRCGLPHPTRRGKGTTQGTNLAVILWYPPRDPKKPLPAELLQPCGYRLGLNTRYASVLYRLPARRRAAP